MTPSSYLRRTNSKAFFRYYWALYGITLLMDCDKNAYAFPEIPWQSPKPFLSTPNFQIWSRDLWITSANPKDIPFYGNISRYLANAVTIPGAPWQKCTSFRSFFPCEVAKLPFIKCLSKNKIEGWISLIKLSISVWGNLFIFIEINIMFRLPPNPCAAPKYYFLWKE